jgi:hypothetical protein
VWVGYILGGASFSPKCSFVSFILSTWALSSLDVVRRAADRTPTASLGHEGCDTHSLERAGYVVAWRWTRDTMTLAAPMCLARHR